MAKRIEDPGAVGEPPNGEPGVIEAAASVVLLLDSGTPPLEALEALRRALRRCGVAIPARRAPRGGG